MRNNANPIVEQEKKDWKTELAKLGTDIFSLPIESMEIIKDQTPKQYQYYTLFWYANTRRFGQPAPISSITMKVKFQGLDAEFFIPVEINFLDPQHITSHVVENIQKTPTIDLCHLAFWTIERTKVLSPQKEEFSYYLNTELTAQDIEFKNGGEIGEKKQQTLAGILHFKQQVKEKIQQHAELSQKICTAYCEVLKFLLDHTTLDINALTESMTKLGYPSDVIQEHLAQLQALPPLRVQKQKNIAQDTLLLLKEKDTLTFANAYKDQGAQLYQNVLKGGPYKALYWNELEVIKQNTEKFRKYLGALHIAFGPGDLSKETQMYKEVLGIEYLDKEPYSPLDPENTKIQQFRKDHCFVGVDTSKIYENKVVCLHDLGFSPLSTNNYDTYFFDDTNSFYSNDDIFHFLKTKKISSTKKKKPVLLQPEKFKGSSFDIFGNTLLNFDKAGQIRLITTFMQSLGEKTTGFVAIHHQMDEKTLLGLYDTPQERVRRESLIKSDYGLERESAGQQNYEFKFWVDQEGTLEMDIQVLKDVMLSVKGQQVKKKAGTVLHLGESGKMSDESFRAVIDQTDAKITDTMKSNDGKVTIYVLSNKDFDLPEDGLGNFSTTFDQNYAQIVRYQKDQLNEAIDILGDGKEKVYPARGPEREEEIKSGVITVGAVPFITQYGRKRYLWMDVKYNKTFQSVGDFVECLGKTDPDEVYITYFNNTMGDADHLTFNKNENADTYTMKIDNERPSSRNRNTNLEVDSKMQTSITTFAKKMAIQVIKDFYM